MKLEVFLFMWILVLTEGVGVYKLLRNYHITSPILSSPVCDKFCRKTCITQCGCDVSCASISVNQQLQICQLHQKYIYDEETEYSEGEGWEYHQLLTDLVKKGDWTLVFRITPNTGQTALNTWTNAGHHDDPANSDGVPPGCETVNGSKPCDRHFRSKILDNWAAYNIQQVKLEVYKNGVAQHHVIFDGVGSDVNSWMDPTRIVSSSWTDLTTSTFNFFAVNGDRGRNFFIQRNYGGCPNDAGWLSVEDGDVGCSWEDLGGGGTPTILFSSADTYTLNDNFDVADALAVLVKTA